MPRFFIEVAYKGTNYAGFQKQDNANTIQAEVEKALKIYFKDNFELTGSSRTDAGVHARQNYFHVDSDKVPVLTEYSKICYHLNAILPPDIVVKSIFPVKEDAHCRFDALSRSYQYYIYQSKDPFLSETAYYYPYKIDIGILQDCARHLIDHTQFETFSKRNTQVYTYNCNILSSEWTIGMNTLIYNVTANRFLRGMVKGMVGTMLKIAHKKESINQFTQIIQSKNSTLANFAVPSHGLTLLKVNFNNLK
jgi:tRNA pseudouridine38-40 synthase